MATTVRLMRPEDDVPLRRLVMKYLKETYASGGDFPPTLENAAAFTQYGIEGAAQGDPCLVADVDGKLVGFLNARGIRFPGMTTRHLTIRTWGTYMLPDYRSKGVAGMLLIVAGRMAKQAGYSRFLGMTHGSGHQEHALSIANRFPGMVIVGHVLEVDLTRKAVSPMTPSKEESSVADA